MQTIDTTSGPPRLIIKAALAWNRERLEAGTRKALEIAQARQEAFGEVAADVLGIAQTATGFILALRDGLAANPQPNLTAKRADRAAAARHAWESALAADVLTRLGYPGPLRYRCDEHNLRDLAAPCSLAH